MKRLLQFLWSGCFHIWEDTAESRYSDSFGSEGPIVYCKCIKCGAHTRFKNAARKRPHTGGK